MEDGSLEKSETTKTKIKNRIWWKLFASFFLLIFAISLSTPLLTGPDEPSHTIKAAAVARGQFFGNVLPNTNPSHSKRGSPYIGVQLPAFFDLQVLTHADCESYQDVYPASCSPKWTISPNTIKQAPTYDGRYSPVYYLPVGLPSLLFPNQFGLMLMRGVSAMLVAAFLASAMLSAFELKNRKIAVSGILLGITPSALILFSNVSPVGLEIATGLCLVCSLSRLLIDYKTVKSRHIWRVAISASMLCFMRGASPLWAAIDIFVVLVAFGTVDSIKHIFLVKSAKLAALFTLIAAILAVVWIFTAQTLDLLGFTPPGSNISLSHIFDHEIANSFAHLYQQIAVYGIITSPITCVIWGIAAIMFLFFAIPKVKLRTAFIFIAFLITIWFLPAVLDLVNYRAFGGQWLGRYLLPISSGLFVIPGMGSIKFSKIPFLDSALSFKVIVVTIFIADISLLFQTLRAYTVGINSSILFFLNPKWQPAISLPVSLILLAVGFFVLFVLATTSKTLQPLQT